jgi:hypothetical protein
MCAVILVAEQDFSWKKPDHPIFFKKFAKPFKIQIVNRAKRIDFKAF